MRFRVTGGEDGTLGIEFQNARYEADAIVELPNKTAEWLLDLGLIEPADAAPTSGKKAKSAEPAPVVEEEPATEPAPAETEEK